MSFLSRISLANRSLVALATIAILIIGALVIPSLKQELYPSLEFPAVTVITPYPGASPSIVEQDVTDPLEQSIQGMQNISQLTSYSNSGSSVIVVEYNFGTDINQASQQISQQINRVQANLPSGVTPQVQTFNINDQPVIQLAVTSNEQEAVLANDLKTKVVPVLSGINGVTQANITGVRDQVVTIQLDLNKLQADGLNVSAVQGALQASNVTLPAGQLTNNGQTFPIVTGNTLNSLSDLQNLVVGAKVSSNCPQTSTGSAGLRSVSWSSDQWQFTKFHFCLQNDEHAGQTERCGDCPADSGSLDLADPHKWQAQPGPLDHKDRKRQHGLHLAGGQPGYCLVTESIGQWREDYRNFRPGTLDHQRGQ